MRIALTIAGSDSIAGAGLQADLKTFAALDVYGASAVTAVTAQNTTGVRDFLALPPEMVRLQIEHVARDVPLAAVKTGMLATAAIVEAVAETLGRIRPPNLVVDPVMTATADARTLLTPEAVQLLRTRLLPLASVVTPNIEEAAVLSGMRVDSPETIREAGRHILDLGPMAVVIKGGHMTGAHAIDLLFHAGTVIEFAAPRVPVGAVHGTGCAFAAALAAGLALGDDVPAAVERAKEYVTGAIERSLTIGRGTRIVNHFWRGLYS